MNSITMGVYRDFIIQARTRKDETPVSQKDAEQMNKTAQAQAKVEARGTPESQEGESVSPFVEVTALCV